MALDSFPQGPIDFAPPKSESPRINNEAFQLMMEASSLRPKDTVQVKAESIESPEEKAERELLESIAVLIDGKGDNKAAIKVLLSQLPEKTLSRPISRPINEKLKALGSDKSVTFLDGSDTRTMKVYRDHKTEPEKGEKSSIKCEFLYEVSAPVKK